MENSSLNTIQGTDVKIFWGEIAPCDHFVQIYETDEVFIQTLESFVAEGFLAEESVVVIATHRHLQALEKRLARRFEIKKLIASDLYIPLDANVALSRFMLNNWPDDRLFHAMVKDLLLRATKNNRKVRAFGEMVAVLWEQGHNGATVYLENLWNEVHKQPFMLYCAYPKSGFRQSARDSITSICKCHTRTIDGKTGPMTEIYYTNSTD